MSLQNQSETVAQPFNLLDLSKTAPLPEDFIVLGCCALRCTNFEMNYCFGCRSTTQCLCIEEECYQCKFIQNDPNVCFVCLTGDAECVIPTGICKIYRQWFCLELVLGCPVQDAYFQYNLDISKSAAKNSSAKATDIVPCAASFCCSYDSCYCKWPECCGCYSRETNCCLEVESVAYRPYFSIPNLQKQNLLCLLWQGNYTCVPVKTCVKSERQQCCMNSRCAFPCDDDVPCLWMPLPFCVCCVNGQCYCACGQNLETIRNLGRPPVMTNQPPNVN